MYMDPNVPDVIEEEDSEGNTIIRRLPKSEKKASATTPVPGDEDRMISKGGIYNWDTRLLVLLPIIGSLCMFVFHCTYVTQTAYSSPSVVLSTRNQDGSQNIIDDFREAYYWLRQNTKEDAVVMSWWDYGYQIAGMADRPTLVDNNTWNNSE